MVIVLHCLKGTDLLIVSMKRTNDYSNKNRFHCSFGHLTFLLGQTCKIVNQKS